MKYSGRHKPATIPAAAKATEIQTKTQADLRVGKPHKATRTHHGHVDREP
jgi:hypothetical protein